MKLLIILCAFISLVICGIGSGRIDVENHHGYELVINNRKYQVAYWTQKDAITNKKILGPLIVLDPAKVDAASIYLTYSKKKEGVQVVYGEKFYADGKNRIIFIEGKNRYRVVEGLIFGELDLKDKAKLRKIILEAYSKKGKQYEKLKKGAPVREL